MDTTEALDEDGTDRPLAIGEQVTTADGRTLRVTARAHACLPRTRDHLVGLARAGGTTTYGALVRDLDLPYPAVGVGRLLDVVAADCARRGEPGLDALVLSADAVRRLGVADAHRHWRPDR